MPVPASPQETVASKSGEVVSVQNALPLDAAQDIGTASADPLSPVNWFLLSADEAYAEWYDLDKWVKIVLRDTYGLPPSILPPFWHRHDELIWELSALHLLWRSSYDSEAPPSGPTMWHRELGEARNRLREWTSLSGTRLDRDRPTRPPAWPGESPTQPVAERQIDDRDEDFHLFVQEDVESRRHVEQRLP